MCASPRLLIVDDEAVICQACQRIFSRQGYEVEENTNSRLGLEWAIERQYDGILLDIKMPEMDGVRFLEELRKIKPDIPVMIMTGYPSIPNAAAAVRLGASDYITKPFTPEQLTQSVQRMLARSRVNGSSEEGSNGESWATREAECRFLNESWMQLEVDGSACVGAILVPPPGATVDEIRLPSVGEVVYQGLPMAAVIFNEGTQHVVPAPASGVVVSVNDRLATDPKLLLESACHDGWMACICTTRIEEETEHCRARHVLLLNCDNSSAARQSERIQSLGCQVQLFEKADILPSTVEKPEETLLILDAAGFGQQGPEILQRINAELPSLRIVVVAPSACPWEIAYRQQKIFYYAVEPFADYEIVEILDTAFCHHHRTNGTGERRKSLAEPVSGIRITNHNGKKVHLFAAPGLLYRQSGLGEQIIDKLVHQSFPISTSPGEAAITSATVLKAASTCDRVMVLRAENASRLPGCLVRDTKAEYVVESRENAGRVTTLIVQPSPQDTGLAGLDQDIIAILAEHIVQEMASY